MALAEAGRYGRREIHVLDSHDKRTTHDVKFMLALQCGSHVGSFGCTDTETELVVRDLSIDFAIRLESRKRQRRAAYKAHPFLVKHVGSIDVGSGVAANWVSEVFSAMGV